MMISRKLCAAFPDIGKSLASRFPAECRQLSLTILLCRHLRFGQIVQVQYTAFPCFVACKRCNVVILWLSCFRPFLFGTFSIFGNEVGSRIHCATETTAGSKTDLFT
jgi:hypothetical protein